MDVDMLQLKSDLLALPTSQRAFLAQELWRSLEGDASDFDETEVLDEAERRNREMSEGRVHGLSHHEVMASLHRRLK